MSYQIKSTPYFRRIFNNSKRNGQLQRLREEYERMQEINERTLEMKMRQIRLKRLFREIEELKEAKSPAILRRRNWIDIPHSINEKPQRFAALPLPKELALEISRRNTRIAEQNSGQIWRTSACMTGKVRAAIEAKRKDKELRQRAAKRISYGNAQSKNNLRELTERKNRRSAGRQLLEPGKIANNNGISMDSLRHTSTSQKAKLMQLHHRINYGNSCSINNMIDVAVAQMRRTQAFVINAKPSTTTIATTDTITSADVYNVNNELAKYVTTNDMQIMDYDKELEYQMQQQRQLNNQQKQCLRQQPLELHFQRQLNSKNTTLALRNSFEMYSQNRNDVNAKDILPKYRAPTGTTVFKRVRLVKNRWHLIRMILPWLRAFTNRIVDSPIHNKESSLPPPPSTNSRIDNMHEIDSSDNIKLVSSLAALNLDNEQQYSADKHEEEQEDKHEDQKNYNGTELTQNIGGQGTELLYE